jgi:CheY-like chemotaxis protein
MRAAAREAGCIGYITKPIETEELLNQIARFLPAVR